jgi:hypothetical protein
MTKKVLTNDEAVTGSKNLFFLFFGTFGRYVTNLRGTYVENVKKSKINSPYYAPSTGGPSNELEAPPSAVALTSNKFNLIGLSYTSNESV